MVQLNLKTYPQIKLAQYKHTDILTISEANQSDFKTMYEEEMAYQYKDQHGHFPVYPVSDNKPMVYPEDVIEYETKQVGCMTFKVPKKKQATNQDFINITGNPEYSR